MNGRTISFTEGMTILEAARAEGVSIPTLCHLPGVEATGVCRICVVEVEGADILLPACATPAGPGMKIQTDSPRVIEVRRTVLSMLVASGQHNCFVMNATEDWTSLQLKAMENPWHQTLCPAWGRCELQDLVVKYGLETTAWGTESRDYPLDDTHPMFVRDYSRCIECGRCIKACNEVQVNLAIPEPYGRRADRPQGWFPVVDYDHCVHCGECVQACPVGALFEKKAFQMSSGNDVTYVRTTCPYCGVGCQQLLHVKDGRIVKVDGVVGAEPNQGRLCVKGRFGYDFIYSEERLTTPLIRENGELRSASWDEALDLVADKLRTIIRESGPDSVAGVSCARSINEDSYQMQKLFRAVIKTNNIDHCART
jgi:predicted molibdopterin-dependent oxidoreductase YjgC